MVGGGVEIKEEKRVIWKRVPCSGRTHAPALRAPRPGGGAVVPAQTGPGPARTQDADFKGARLWAKGVRLELEALLLCKVCLLPATAAASEEGVTLPRGATPPSPTPSSEPLSGPRRGTQTLSRGGGCMSRSLRSTRGLKTTCFGERPGRRGARPGVPRGCRWGRCVQSHTRGLCSKGL